MKLFTFFPTKPSPHPVVATLRMRLSKKLGQGATVSSGKFDHNRMVSEGVEFLSTNLVECFMIIFDILIAFFLEFKSQFNCEQLQQSEARRFEKGIGVTLSKSFKFRILSILSMKFSKQSSWNHFAVFFGASSRGRQPKICFLLWGAFCPISTFFINPS